MMLRGCNAAAPCSPCAGFPDKMPSDPLGATPAPTNMHPWRIEPLLSAPLKHPKAVKNALRLTIQPSNKTTGAQSPLQRCADDGLERESKIIF
ncbi:hypothetical protein [Halopseudomonas sp.]|uniref:hypothetical protein n=1 Tax=Halopseudomonas sp. TaxID=2901191 RepID=UPI00311FC3BA